MRTRDPASSFDAIDWLDADAKIAYLRINFFGPETPREVRAALYHLHAAGARRLVLDLRFNTGGMLSSGVEVADLSFCAMGRLSKSRGAAPIASDSPPATTGNRPRNCRSRC